MKRYHRQAADLWRRRATPECVRSYDLAVKLMPWLSPWLKLCELSFEYVKSQLSSELKTEALHIPNLKSGQKPKDPPNTPTYMQQK